MTATTAKRTVTITYSGLLAGTQDLAADDNDATPAVVELKALTTGANTVSVPTGATACTIVPPAENTVSIKLDSNTGIRIHGTDPTSIALDSSVTSFVLYVASAVTPRLYWS